MELPKTYKVDESRNDAYFKAKFKSPMKGVLIGSGLLFVFCVLVLFQKEELDAYSFIAVIIIMAAMTGFVAFATFMVGANDVYDNQIIELTNRGVKSSGRGFNAEMAFREIAVVKHKPHGLILVREGWWNELVLGKLEYYRVTSNYENIIFIPSKQERFEEIV